MADSALSWLIDYMDISITLILFVITFTLGWLALGGGNNAPPGPTHWPIVGTFLQIWKTGGDNMHLFYQQIHKKYGTVAQIYFGSYPIVLLSGYDVVNEMFGNKRDDILGRPDFIPGIQRSKHHRTGIPFGNGTTWTKARETMLSAMSVVLKSSSHEDLVLEEVESLVKEFTDKEGVAFQPREHLIQLSLSWLSGSAIGKRYHRNDHVYKKLLQYCLDIMNNDNLFSPSGTIPVFGYLPFVNKSHKIYVAGVEGVDKLMLSEIQVRKSTNTKSKLESALDVFLIEQRKDPDCKTFSDYAIAVYMGDYIVAGIQNVAYTLDWLLLYSVAHPLIQQRCHQEIQKVCGEKDPVKFSDIDQLPYVSATVYETQRMATVVQTSIPYYALKDMTIKDYHIPKGTMIASCLGSVHMDETQWTEPQQFNPDRFLDTDGKLTKRPDGFMPFGKGARICPGYSIVLKGITVIFANLLQSLEFTDNGKVILGGKFTSGLHPLSNEIIAKKRS